MDYWNLTYRIQFPLPSFFLNSSFTDCRSINNADWALLLWGSCDIFTHVNLNGTCWPLFSGQQTQVAPSLWHIDNHICVFNRRNFCVILQRMYMYFLVLMSPRRKHFRRHDSSGEGEATKKYFPILGVADPRFQGKAKILTKKFWKLKIIHFNFFFFSKKSRFHANCWFYIH